LALSLDRFYPSTLEWLLEPKDAGVRYLALRDLVKLPSDDAQLMSARGAAYEQGPIGRILNNMNPEGYWSKPGPGYSPKYRSTVWALILLAQLGASIDDDERVGQACQYLLDHAWAEGGYFSHSGAPSGTFDCLQGNLCWALFELGCKDIRLAQAFEWMARSVTGEGVAPQEDKQAEVRYYKYQCGPGFMCGANDELPCAWGAVKVMLAFSRLPKAQHTDQIRKAIETGVDFIFSVEPITAAWPYCKTIHKGWWKFGFPVFYVTDLLQVAEAITNLGLGNDHRLANLMQLIREKADDEGKWLLENEYNSKTWGNYGIKGEPNKWVTLRALRVFNKRS